MDNTVSENTEKKTIEVKQSFFSSAISDISAYIQLVDTKVSINNGCGCCHYYGRGCLLRTH